MKFIIYIFSIAFTAFLAVSCTKDFDEINHKSETFTTTDDGALLNGIIRSLRTGDREYRYVNSEILYPQSQLAVLIRPGSRGDLSLGTEELWSNYYTTLPNFRELETRFQEMKQRQIVINMKAITGILRAYKTFRMTDLFGDMPFTEAGYVYQTGEQHPGYDTQESIYKTLLNDLYVADTSLRTPTAFTGDPAEYAGFRIDSSRYREFMNHDILFNGDLMKWRKFANSLRLRYALRMSDVEPEMAGEIVRDILLNDKPLFMGAYYGSVFKEYAGLIPGNLAYSNTGKFRAVAAQPNLRMGTVVWNQFYRDNIFDPRCFYFFETNNGGQWAPFPDTGISEGGTPYSTLRDYDSAFSNKGAGCAYSPLNYFLMRDETRVPEIFISGAEVHFLKAEAYFKGIGVTADENLALEELLLGVLTSIESWKDIMEQTRLKHGGGFGEHIAVTADFLTWQMAFSFTFSPEALYAQRWLDLFMQPAEAFALARQTKLTPADGKTTLICRLPIPPGEKNFNFEKFSSHYGAHGDDPGVKMWWMK